MSKEADKVIGAFFARRSARAGRSDYYGGPRYETDGRTFRVWGNNVARWQNGKIRACDAGYQTKLTKDRLNDLFDAGGLNCGLHQERGQWKLWCRDTGKTVKWPGCITFKPRR
jgi:hypothetical protein